MKKYSNQPGNLITLIFFLVFSLVQPITSFAASTPALGAADAFAILSSTFTNTAPGTTITGDFGYTTGPIVLPILVGTTHIADSVYNQAGIDQGTILANLNGQTCISLGTTVALDSIDIGSGPGIFTPGCYSSSGAMNITTGTTVTLNGSGTFIFRPGGALNTEANSIVTLNGTSACDVFWTPVATTLGADSVFKGTIIDTAAITMENNVNLNGRALSFGQTVTTVSNDTITVPTCTTTPATLHLIKHVVGSTAAASDFLLSVKFSGLDIGGSPAFGADLSGISYSLLTAGIYAISESPDVTYTQSFSGDCDLNGNITLYPGYDKTCTLTNTYSTPPPRVVRTGGGAIPFVTPVVVSPIITQQTPAEIIQPIVSMPTEIVPIVSVVAPTPSFPDTGFPPRENSSSSGILILYAIFSFFVIRRFVQKRDSV
jgi:hypothetical protein